jgi:tRNA(Arg) A34 adenosine deaminase TadA
MTVDEIALDDSAAALLRRAIAIAQTARARGNHPFGALLADSAGAILLESENAVTTTGDATAHAEMLLASAASRSLRSEERAGATLYTSTEPCAMCAGAIYWSGIGRVLYAMPESRLLALTGSDPANPTMQLDCRVVLRSGQRPIEVVGPALVDEAIAVHLGFWGVSAPD